MEKIMAQIASAMISTAMSENGNAGTAGLNPNTNSSKSISQLMKGA